MGQPVKVTVSCPRSPQSRRPWEITTALMSAYSPYRAPPDTDPTYNCSMMAESAQTGWWTQLKGVLADLTPCITAHLRLVWLNRMVDLDQIQATSSLGLRGKDY